MKQTLIIGDIHGCYAELLALLDAAGLNHDDEIIALGDIVDRGPASPDVLAFFHRQPHAVSLLGNHERNHLRAPRGVPVSRSQAITRQQLGEAGYPAAVRRLARFPLSRELPDALLVHGYWEPGLPLAEQRETVIVGALGGEAYLKAHYRDPWYVHYDGPKPLIVGHHNYTQSNRPLIYRERVFGLDTGCCYGGALTGLLLPSFRLVSVPSRSNHWLALRQAHPVAPPPPPSRAASQWDDDSLALLDRLAAWAAVEEVLLRTALNAELDLASLSGRMQGRLYAERGRERPGTLLLLVARRRALTRECLQVVLRTPDAAWALAAQLGLVDAPGSAAGGPP